MMSNEYLFIVCFVTVFIFIVLYVRWLRRMDHRRPDLPRVPTMAYFMTDEGQVQEGIKETSALYLSWKVDIIENLFIFLSACMIYRPCLLGYPWKLKAGIGSLFDHCVTLWQWLLFWQSYMEELLFRWIFSVGPVLLKLLPNNMNMCVI